MKTFATYTLCATIIGYISCFSSFAQTTSKEIVHNFFQVYFSDGAASALKFAQSTNQDLNSEHGGIDSLRAKIEIIDNAGKYTSYELIREEQAGESYIVSSYLVKHEKRPFKFTFVLFKSHKDWQILNFQIEDDLYRISTKEVSLGTDKLLYPYKTSQHSLSLNSTTLFTSKNINSFMMFASLNYRYHYRRNHIFKIIAGITYDGTQMLFGPYISQEPSRRGEVIEEGGADVEGAAWLLLGYENYLRSHSVRPFWSVAGGFMLPGYNEPYAYGAKNVIPCALMQVGISLENPFFSLKPSFGYLLSGSTDIFAEYYNGIKPENNEVIGRGSFTSPVINLEIGFRF